MATQKLEVPAAVMGCLLFSTADEHSRNARMGLFMRLWFHALKHQDPSAALGQRFLAADEVQLALLDNLLVERDGKLFLTGPHRDPAWLASEPKAWLTYAIAAVDHDVVKVGKTTDLDKRLRTLQTSSAHPLRVIGTLAGDREQEVHDILDRACARLFGEWFRHDVRTAEILRGLGFSAEVA